MYKNLFLLIGITMLLMGCLFEKKTTSNKKIKQGITGYVFRVAGNQMPAPNAPAPQPQPLSTTIYIYELTNIKDVKRITESAMYTAIRTRLVDSTLSDSKGAFAVSLPAGSYSLFAKVDGHFYANSYDEKNNIQSVYVQPDSVATITIQISNNAVY
ncbi:MAG: carboxypeptidase-like regulatory domain-containing protein [Hydrotalea flava]|uniref:carboxypeptidase-like regulatory domain-containing protein n=1 Tax=Hydrotalea TaxID=1004300 RepID=UPI0010262E4C|nr:MULTISPECIES: carboxypeptidase-like regulatory domain-containing protein [Hydrotalea]MBY0349287.1 carboxypeptidase-like regulatory domain-containing protein [Hydrotalea flava]RWZ89062.1 MAG: carboxypeptidase regulatory-like domain-containing protein [Hydrotalea sp. AMD]